jgi:hypothetical protein
MVIVLFASASIALIMAILHAWLLSIPLLSGGVFILQLGLWMGGLIIWFKQITVKFSNILSQI